MNKFLILIILAALILGVVFFDFTNNEDTLVNSKINSVDFEVIKPPQINDINSNLNTSSQANKVKTNLNASNNTNDFERNLKERGKDSHESEYPFTKQGQVYMSKGELLLQHKKRIEVDPKYYSVDLFKEVEQAKYNLKISKEIAVLSKKLFIDTDEGKIMDKDVYKRMNELSNNLSTTVLKQQQKYEQ